MAPLDDTDEEVPLLDKAQVKRERDANVSARSTAPIYREMRDRRHERDSHSRWT